MTGQTQSNDAAPLSEIYSPSTSSVPRASTWAVWTLFVLSVGVLALSVGRGSEWSVPGLLEIDGLTAIMWVVVTFFSGIVHSYSRRYMAGDSGVERFFATVFGFTLVVMTLTAADHVALFAAAWLAMGMAMASLIGHDREWTQAREAGALARRYFLTSTGLLAIGLVALAAATGATTISGILAGVESVSGPARIVALATIFLAAIIQSALVPFHRWLLSSMTAPTPASALMHAGFVNAGGVLLTRFAPLYADALAAMSVIVVVGAVSALFGQAALLVQTDVKRKLGSSTLAQMGFMILQCGLGFFSAAITHLILHGFYKAYLFLSSGAAVEQTTPKKKSREGLGAVELLVGLVTAVGGGALFAVLTHKGAELNSGIVLTAVVVLTTLHATRDILHRSSLSPAARLASTPAVVLTAIGVYAAMFNAISSVMADVPASKAPTELTAVHVGVIGLFALAYVATALGWHRSSKRLYVSLLNLAQPAPDTVLTNKEEYNE